MALPRVARCHHSRSRGARTCSTSSRSSVPRARRSAATFAPKLGLDLIGGTEIILQPQLAKGADSHRRPAEPGRRDHPRANRRGGCLRAVDQHAGHRRQREHRRSRSRARSMTQTAVTHHEGREAELPRGARDVCGDRGDLVADAQRPGATSTPTPSPQRSLSNTPTSKPTNGSDLAYVTPALAGASTTNFNCKSDAALRREPRAGQQAARHLRLRRATEKFILGPVELSGHRDHRRRGRTRHHQPGRIHRRVGRQHHLQQRGRREVRGHRQPPHRADLAAQPVRRRARRPGHHEPAGAGRRRRSPQITG